ncbi:hypothetical protein DdX_15986 [Ditylenchus destructor]|uniref:Uncharacterized protein n=1 Tax=Ditylenchus destructor TaxID=166010 RepID=A0AAD4MPG8_9BILA|nr:hypothetical protein DdX_15986 [Ditylenchus destructor]
MSSSADNRNFQELKSRLFRRWNPVPDVYSQWDDIVHWSNKQSRSPAPLRICKCRDHLKTDPETVIHKSESLPDLDRDVIEEADIEVINMEDVPELEILKAKLRLWRIRMYGGIYKNR